LKKLLFLILFFYISLFSQPLELTKAEKDYIQNKKVVYVSSEIGYEPYDFLKNGKPSGYSIDLLNILLEDTGLEIKFVTKSWNELLEDLANKKIDLLHTIFKTSKREEIYNFSNGYSKVVRSYIINEESDDIRSIKELYGKKVGVSKGWSEIEFLKKHPQIEMVYYKNLKEKLNAIAIGEIDAIINSTSVAHYYIKKYGYTNIKISNVVPEERGESLKEFHFATLKEDKHLISILNKAYDNLTIEVLDSLYKKWFGVSEQNNIKPVLFNKKEREYLNNKQSLSLCIDPNWMPFESFKDGEYIGMSADYFKIFQEKIGIPIDVLKVDTWTQSLKLGKEGKCDVFSLIMPTPERRRYLNFTKEYFKTPLVFASELHKSWVDDFTQIKEKRIGIVKGYAYGELLRLRYPNLNLIEVKSVEDGLTKIEKGELYGFIGTLASVGYHIQKNHIGQIKINGKFEDEWKLGVGTQKEQAILKDIFNKTIESITPTQHQNILNRWISISVEEKQLNKLSVEEENFLSNHPTIKFLVRSSRPPFAFVESKKATGIAVDYIKKIASKVGFKPEFIIENIALKDSFTLLSQKNSEFDTLLFTVFNDDREKRFFFGDTYLSYPVMIITNKNLPYVGSLSDLSDHTVVIERGFNIVDWVKQDYPQLNVVEVPSTIDALRRVDENEDTVYIGNMAVANYMIANGTFENIKIAAPSGYGNIDYKFVAPKHLKPLISILNKGYRQITPAEHNLIIQKWLSSKTIEKTDYSLIWKIIGVFLLILIWILWWSRKLQLAKIKTESALNKLEKTRKKLHKQKEEFELIFKYSKDGIAIIDTNTNFLNMNNAYLNMTGFTKKEMVCKSYLDIVLKEDENRVKEAIEECVRVGYVENFQKTYKVAKNKRVDVNVSMSLLPDKKRILIVSKDVSSLKLLEEQARLASMGQMIGNIAHQWRQPLSLITTSASGVKLKIEYNEFDNNYIVENMDNIMKQSNYLSKTIDNFRNFIKNDRSYKTLSVKSVIDQAISIITASLKNNYINLVVDLNHDIYIEGNENELAEALINLLNNSKDALSENIKSEEDRFIFITTKKLNNGNLKISVLDSAGGIDNKIIKRIFEPYFTTKHQSIGTGLGLSMVDKIIRERHKGVITVNNEEFVYKNRIYKGACFNIEFKPLDS